MDKLFLSQHCLFELDAPIMRLAGPDVPSMPFSPNLENEVMMRIHHYFIF
jgi:2-oxoisovalerate dehydrogenase E1 component beta subunit